MPSSPEKTARAMTSPAKGQPSRVGKPWRFLAAGGALVSLLALFAWGLTRDPRQIPTPLIGKEASPFTLALFDGGAFRLAEQRGKVVVLNVWAAWRKYRDQGVMVVGLDYQDREADARAFIQRFGQTFPNGPGQGSKIAIEYGVYGVPETFFIDHAGRMYAKHIGEINWETLEANIEEGLARRRQQLGAAGPAVAGQQ